MPHFEYDAPMPTSSIRFGQLILDELATGDKRVLSLTVSIRKVLNRTGPVKGNLNAMITSALRKLVAAGTIVDADGVYSLASSATALRA